MQIKQTTFQWSINLDDSAFNFYKHYCKNNLNSKLVNGKMF